MIREYSSNNEIVDKMYGMEITGNIVPPAGYQTITYDNGKPNGNAIVILSDIVYWYRPQEIRDEMTGSFTGIRKKFKEDLLQRSYQQLADQFGFSKRQAASAVKELERLKVIRRVFRNLMIKGRTINNVLYIELIPERLQELTYPKKKESSPLRSRGTGITLESKRAAHATVTAASSKCQTNTKSTEETTDKDYPIFSIRQEQERFKEQIGYDAIAVDLPLRTAQLDELVSVAVDVLTSNKKSIRVNREERPTEYVCERLRSLNTEHVKYILESLSNSKMAIKDVRAVLITTLYNAPASIDSYYTAKVNHDLSNGSCG